MDADPNGVGIPAARVSLYLSTRNCLSNMDVEVLADKNHVVRAEGFALEEFQAKMEIVRKPGK